MDLSIELDNISFEELVQRLKEILPIQLDTEVNQFNVCLTHLLQNFIIVFPKDGDLKGYLETVKTIARPGATVETRMIPARKFFEAVYEGKQAKVQTVDQLFEKNESALQSTMNRIPYLDSINFEEKWKKLSPKNKEATWKIVHQMIERSIRSINFYGANPEQLAKVLMLQKGKEGNVDIAAMAAMASMAENILEAQVSKK